MAKLEISIECRHIRVNGTKCCAAALIDNAWCYFHDRIYREQRQKHAHEAAGRRSQTTLSGTTPEMTKAEVTTAEITTTDYGCIPVIQPVQRDQPIDLPLLEDISSVQLAISRVLTALATNTIEPKRAGLLLYGLQIAAQNLPREELQKWHTVTDVAETEEGFHVAMAEPWKPRGESFAIMAKRLRLALKRYDAHQQSSLTQEASPGS